MKRYIVIIFFLATLYSCDDIFEKDLTSSEISIIAPKGNSIVATGEICFDCELVEEATRYRITIVSPSFSKANIVVNDVQIIPDSLAYNISHKQLLKPGEYQWSVQAFNSSSSTKRQVYDLTVIADSELIDE